jgi:hypothetical protein
MLEYARHYQLDSDVAEALFTIVRMLDAEYMKHETERMRRAFEVPRG